MRRLLPSSAAEVDGTAYAGLEPPDGPWLAVGMVTSVDGATVVDGGSGGLGGAGDLAAFRALRSLADVVLVGAGTVRAERYRPPRRRDVDARRARGQAPAPTLAVLTGSGDLDPGLPLFGDPERRPVVLTTRRADPGRLDALRAVADVEVVGEQDVPPQQAVAALARRGLTRVLCEGGPSLVHRVLADGLVDELFVTIAPLLVGDAGPHLVAGALDVPVDMSLHELRAHGSEVLLRYRVLPRR